MAKVLTGKVIANKMNDTAVVEVIRLLPHPLYHKLLRRSKHFKVALNGFTLTVGQTVKIVETRKVAKDKYFKVQEIVEKSHKQEVKTEKKVKATKGAKEE